MNKTALITGATGGIGQEICKQLAQRGYRLLLVDFDGAKLSDMAAQYPRAETYTLDQRDLAAVEAFCDSRIASGETIDVAVVNAGMIMIGDLADSDRSALTDQLTVNLVSSSILIQSLAKRMALDRRGHILSTVSMGGIVSLRGSSAYSASKFGLRGLLWALRDELRAKGVHVTGVYPAGVDTPMLRHEAQHGGSALNFVGKPVSVTDVARAFMRAIDKPRLEIYVPSSEGITGRIAGAWPGLLLRLYPLLERIGESGRKKFMKRIEGSS
ncbi:MAG: SDR family NAD(P)-dependent oxidoreductase [Pseudomonadota bacterium]